MIQSNNERAIDLLEIQEEIKVEKNQLRQLQNILLVEMKRTLVVLKKDLKIMSMNKKISVNKEER